MLKTKFISQQTEVVDILLLYRCANLGKYERILSYTPRILVSWFRFDRYTVGDGENEKDPARAGGLHTQDAGTTRKGKWSTLDTMGAMQH